MGRLWSGDPDSYRPNLPVVWGVQPHKGLIYFQRHQFGFVDRQAGSEDREGIDNRAGTVRGWINHVLTHREWDDFEKRFRRRDHEVLLWSSAHERGMLWTAFA